MLKLFVLLSLVAFACADLRMASQPKKEWKVQQRNRKVPFQQNYALYMEPSDFNYEGLKKQRDGGGYDNFLRSNIDNEQDRRNFDTEDGKDHLPFRSYETAANDVGQTTVKHKMEAVQEAMVNVDAAGNYILAEPGVPFTMPLRWNNPHSAELEVNIWIFKKTGGPYVIPITKPVCSGEGYQDNVFTFTVPQNFNSVASCRQVGECVLQLYAHSVESRMYASGTPIVVKGGTGAWNPGTIQEAKQDVKFDLKSLRRLCLPRSDPGNEADHRSAVVYKARLSSDVYNHAYQNSDFSPYAGQQPQFISQNLQASCILKMTVGNFGELGKQYMQKTASIARQYAKRLDKKARDLIRRYEVISNSMIKHIEDQVKNTDILRAMPQPAGSTECTEWRDQWDRKAGGRMRGADRTGGYCPADYKCFCHGDCFQGHGKDDAQRDAYCAKTIALDNGLLKPDPATEIARVGKSPQKTETCFRCAEVGSTTTRRHNTNTYIPSFEIRGADTIEKALQYIAPIYLKSGYMTHPETGEITKKGDTMAITQIYMAVLTEMWDEFKMASDGSYVEQYYKKVYDKLLEPKADSLEKYKFTYRGPVLKTTTATLSDANGGTNHNYKKLNAAGAKDGGYYSAAKAWPLQARGTGSSTAVPNTAGPLNGKIPSSFNTDIQGTIAPTRTGGGNTVYKLPPDPAPVTSCSNARADLTAEAEITQELPNMDGLNGDADCDDYAFVIKQQNKHYADCDAAKLADPTYVCPEFEAECELPGAKAQLPTDLFVNGGDFDPNAPQLGSASNAAPSMVIALLVGLVALLL
jgi:hypothetical protein